MSRMRKRFLDCPGLDIDECESYGKHFAEMQRDLMFFIGDLQRYAKAKWPETHHQIWPEWISPGMLARAEGVCKAYPNEDQRQTEATYTQYMKVAGKHDRHERLAEMVTLGQTSDESRKATHENDGGTRWLLAIDTNNFLCKFWFSGAGLEAAASVSSWIVRTVARLKEKGLTDVACCFDSPTNHRKELTAEWEDKYKGRRTEKDPELDQQLKLVRQLLEGHGFACVSVDGMEADDCMASFAKQFNGRVTLLSQDKDFRQSLSSHCNILLDVEWVEDEESGEMVPVYKWLSAKEHTDSTGIPPSKWAEFQSIMGDNVDGVKGAIGVGEKGAADLIKTFGSAEAAIQAAKDDDERIKPAKRKALIEFEPLLETTRKLVTLVDSLPLPDTTRV